jgi:hypothetical protein
MEEPYPGLIRKDILLMLESKLSSFMKFIPKLIL